MALIAVECNEVAFDWRLIKSKITQSNKITLVDKWNHLTSLFLTKLLVDFRNWLSKWNDLNVCLKWSTVNIWYILCIWKKKGGNWWPFCFLSQSTSFDYKKVRDLSKSTILCIILEEKLTLKTCSSSNVTCSVSRLFPVRREMTFKTVPTS